MSSASRREVEIKLPLSGARAGRELLRRAGFRVTTRRTFEANTVFDTDSLALRGRRELLRLRTYGRRHTLTYKGPPAAARHKSREEIETQVADAAEARALLERLGYRAVFRYEKYRTEWAGAGEPGHATLDETPIGTFLELEGPPRWIDRTARALGFAPRDYITASYGAIYCEDCRRRGVAPTHMTF
jgi:adenylate cyclase class 2